MKIVRAMTIKKATLAFLLKKVSLISAYILAVFFALAVAGFFYLAATASLGNNLQADKMIQTSVIYDRSGNHVLWKIHGEENRKTISHEEIPDTIRAATIAAEDDSFYTHPGVDILSTVRALKSNIETGSIGQGGSTITQQLARNAYLSREKTLKRKILEAAYAIKIEMRYEKDEILDAYLNQVPYGSNAYGIETASETYFKKQARDLTLDEAALLAALTKATSFYSPYGTRREALAERQKNILRRVGELELRSPSEVEEALATDTFQKLVLPAQPIEAPHFVFYTLDILEKKYGKELLEKGGFKIYTTLDYDKQKLAENILANSDAHLARYGATNASLVAIDPKNGQILTMIGSKNYFDLEIDGEVNVATSPRQPGSSFKPIVYAKAFEKGFQPETLVLDARTDFGRDGSGRVYVPQNYDSSFHGVVSIRQALAMSLNVPAVKTLRAIGLDDALEMAHRLGITTLNDRHRYGLSLVIGGGEVTLLDETSAFSVFANDGKRNPVDPILKIEDAGGNVIEKNQPKNLPAVDPQIARKINSVLSDNAARTPVFGSRSQLFISGHAVAVKTGTTQEYRDAWTVGYTPDIAVGVWVGNNDNRPMKSGAAGALVAAPVWNKFFSKAISAYPDGAFLAYEKGSENSSPEISPDARLRLKEKVTYYKISSGKEISEKKARGLGADKVAIKTEFVSIDQDEEEFFSGKGKPVL